MKWLADIAQRQNLPVCVLAQFQPAIHYNYKTALSNTVVENIIHWKNMMLRTTQNSLKLINKILTYFSKKQ